MNILGISCHYHDAAAALLCDGELAAASQEERFSRVKHDSSFPAGAVAFCLAEAGLAAKDLDYVVFYEKPFVKFARILQSSFARYPRGWKLFREAARTWLGEKLWIKTLIEGELDVPGEKVLFSEHHLSHAAGAFLCSPFETAAVVTIDGVGEWTTAAVGVGRGTEVKLLREIRFPHSLGLLYSTFTAFLGFKVNQGEYKVMGMAAYGEPKYVDMVERLIEMDETGGFRLAPKYFAFVDGVDRPYGRAFLDLFGRPREPDSPFVTAAIDPDAPADAEDVAACQYYADVAASVQRVTEEVVLRMTRSVRAQTHLANLCLGGGVALNSVANGRVARESGFADVYVQPAAGDAGGALGAALYVYHTVLGHPRRFVMDRTYWGRRSGRQEIRGALEAASLRYQEVGDPEMLERVASAIAAGEVVGWFQGRCEWGPRALGNRSILADPRRARMKDIVNRKIKFREPFRPFAPSVLAGRAGEYFDLPGAAGRLAGEMMLLVVPIRPERRGEIPAVDHQGTARPQVVRREVNGRYYDLIQRFERLTGVPMVLNTSFNLRGEPIVNTPADAIGTFARSGLDMLVLEGFIVSKEKA